jgi:plasmid stabilization system protein ParE
MAIEVKITFSRSALNDLDDVLDYYCEQKVPQVGERLVAKIIKDIELLG